MKLIGELKKQVESTSTKEEAKDVIANAGMELTDDELEMVTGGGGREYYCGINGHHYSGPAVWDESLRKRVQRCSLCGCPREI